MISIILPSLNTPLQFLKERIASIKNQSFKDWECIVIDGFSNNGSWEFILDSTKNDDRFSFYQKPPKGIYNAWNEGITLAKGEYIYIATSDDTFTNDFLEEMHKTLSQYPDCDIAHCCLYIIDEHNNLFKSQWIDWEKVKFYGEKITFYHKRIAPYDAIVHFGWSTVYTSITQLLIKKTLFNKIGLFAVNYGAVADFEWGLRAALTSNIIHIPKFLAYWRRHNTQASDENYLNSSLFFEDLVKMAQNSIKTIRSKQNINIPDLKRLYVIYIFNQIRHAKQGNKLYYLLKNILVNPNTTLQVLFESCFFTKNINIERYLKSELKERGLDDNLLKIENSYQ